MLISFKLFFCRKLYFETLHFYLNSNLFIAIGPFNFPCLTTEYVCKSLMNFYLVKKAVKMRLVERGGGTN
jgi:hypothetical protein